MKITSIPKGFSKKDDRLNWAKERNHYFTEKAIHTGPKSTVTLFYLLQYLYTLIYGTFYHSRNSDFRTFFFDLSVNYLNNVAYKFVVFHSPYPYNPNYWKFSKVLVL